jgi:hypothetical protein
MLVVIHQQMLILLIMILCKLQNACWLRIFDIVAQDNIHFEKILSDVNKLLINKFNKLQYIK